MERTWFGILPEFSSLRIPAVLEELRLQWGLRAAQPLGSQALTSYTLGMSFCAISNSLTRFVCGSLWDRQAQSGLSEGLGRRIRGFCSNSAISLCPSVLIKDLGLRSVGFGQDRQDWQAKVKFWRLSSEQKRAERHNDGPSLVPVSLQGWGSDYKASEN